ncbi:Ig-like domain-containing protein [Rheinheimera pacifica]|uniref:Ig-like domain-containing protein n=1 Tax=Rheinheimera pacifica TaxID=173990 RepID=UPI00216A0729|nr:Ig-like domain-containing protein [Rheinheimera pacifica]
MIADSLLLGSGASAKVELTALVRDSNNVVVPGVPVTFASDSGELVQIDAITAANGTAKATLTTQTNKNNRDIVITARVQQQTSQLTVAVSGTSIEVAAPNSVVLGDTTSIDVFLTDSNDIGIPNTEIEVTSALGNTLSDTSPETVGSAGKASFTYTAVNSGIDRLTVTALGATSTITLNVSADEFAFVAGANEAEIPEVNLNTAKELVVEWLVNGSANVGENIIFNTTRGAIADQAANLGSAVTAQGITDANGLAQTFVRSQFAGLATISATGGVGGDAVSAKKVIEFVAVNPTKIETQAFPAQVGAGESSAVRAIVRDVNNNPVKNQVVVFSLDNAAGGVISTGTAVTNSQGIASTVFTADANTGAGVESLNLVIKAALQSNNAISDETDIAVGKRTLFFRFGTGNVITKPSISTYAKEFSIIVTDSSGNPVANQLLNVAVVPTGYRKGFWVASPPAPAAFKVWEPSVTASCANEDANLNGILDPGEDQNLDGQLTPGNVAVVPRTVTADDSGIAVFTITYPQDYGAWIDVRLQVSGFAAGTENVAYRDYGLPVSSADVTTETSPPPANPLGFSNNCGDAL